MNKKIFWLLAIGYTALVMILYYVFETALGTFLRQLSFFALIFSVLWFIYRLIKDSIRLFIYKRKKKNQQKKEKKYE